MTSNHLQSVQLSCTMWQWSDKRGVCVIQALDLKWVIKA